MIYDLSLLLALVFETCAKTAKGLERRSPRGGCCSKTCTFFRKCFTKKHKSEKSDVRRWLAGVALALEIFLAQVEATFVERRASLYFFQVFLCDRPRTVTSSIVCVLEPCWPLLYPVDHYVTLHCVVAPYRIKRWLVVTQW